MPYLRLRAVVALMLACCWGLALPAMGKGVNLDRILIQHQMYVVTTERPDSISKHVFELHLKNQSTLTVSELFTRSKGLKDEESVLFIIDRSKAKRFIPEEERLMPCPTSAIDANQVILYAQKAAGRNAWEILVSAPNEKWLQWELARVCTSDIRSRALNERGSILDRYQVKRVCIVSTEGRQVADDWVRGQTRPGGDAIDWDFVPAASWTESTGADTDLIFILDRQKMDGVPAGLVASLPRAMQSWFATDASRTDMATEKEVVRDAAGQSRSVYAIVAPHARQMRMALGQYGSLGRVPESLQQWKFRDLSAYDQVVVVARPGDRSNESDAGIVNDFAGKLTSALSTLDTGFRCVSRQDLKELIYAAVPTGDGKLDSTTLTKIQSQLGRARAIVVADVSAVDANTSFTANTPLCETSSYPAFTAPQPEEPSHPNAESKSLFGKHKYDPAVNGTRENNPGYIRDHYEYHHKLLPEYEDAIREWKRDKEDYEDRRRYHEMDWRMTVDVLQSAKVAGNLRIYDIRGLDADTLGQVVFSCPLNGRDEHRGMHKSNHVVVQGEGNSPGTPDVPDAHPGVEDMTVVSDAIEGSCKAAIGELVSSAILPSDVPDLKPDVTTPPETLIERVDIDAVGAVKLNARPTGAALTGARESAMADALSKLVRDLQVACPGALASEDDIRAKMKITSEGWNAQTSEYRVKIRFEGDVLVRGIIE